MKEEERVRRIFIGMSEVAWLRCGPALETQLKSFKSNNDRSEMIQYVKKKRVVIY